MKQCHIKALREKSIQTGVDLRAALTFVKETLRVNPCFDVNTLKIQNGAIYHG